MYRVPRDVGAMEAHQVALDVAIVVRVDSAKRSRSDVLLVDIVYSNSATASRASAGVASPRVMRMILPSRSS